MKRALMFCFVGLLCMVAIPYAAVGWDFPGNLTVQDEVGIGTTSPTAQLGIQTKSNSAQLTGTVSVNTGALTINGSGTKFTTELAVGNVVTIDNRQYTVTYIFSDTSLFIDFPYYQGVTASGVSLYLGTVTTPPLLTINNVTNNGVAVPKVFVTDIGYVGIGTTNPQTPLEVDGALKAKSIKSTSTVESSSLNLTGGPTNAVAGRMNGLSIGILNAAANNNKNRALCWSVGGLIGYCTSAIGSNGVCTCVAIQ